MTTSQIIDLSLAMLNVIVGVAVLIRSRRWLGHATVPTIALGSYFMLRAAARLLDVFEPDGANRNAMLDIGIDVLLAFTLIVVLFTIEGMLRGVAAREDAAHYRAEEYARARRHYTQVVRHRIFNPLAVIRGSAQTLRDRPEIVDPTRGQLLEAIVDASDEIETISLEPERRDDNERGLDAFPRGVDGERRTKRYPDGPSGPS